MSRSGGKIWAPEAYAQGKMLDNSGWAKLLPRGITPSDKDLCFDDYPSCRQLVCEISRSHSHWHELEPGQRMAYETDVKHGYTAILLKHSVPIGREIDTVRDFESFAVMSLDETGEVMCGRPQAGSEWPAYVVKFYSRSKRK